MIKIGLVSYKFVNNDIEYNLSQIEKAISKSNGVNLLCFGEAFLQGFDAFSWNFDKDRDIAITQDSLLMQKIKEISQNHKIDLAVGYLERDCDSLYSSYAIIIDGELKYNYRRISLGWKEVSLVDEHYKEGNEIVNFKYKGQNISVALCGDLWEYPTKFKTDGILLWPVYVNFDLDEWRQYEQEYADQALIASKNTLLVNSISDSPKSYGGAFQFCDGKIIERLKYDKQSILIIEI